MSDTKKKRELYNKKFQEIKSEFNDKVSSWSDDQLSDHLKRVERYYSQNSQKVNLLGDFSSHGNYVYHWHTYDKNPTKLERRRQLGWTFATREEAQQAGLEDRRTQDANILGDSCVEMSHGNCQAVLLRIPKELFELNKKAKEKLRANEPLFDHEGNPVTLKVDSDDGQNLTRTRDEGIISME